MSAFIVSNETMSNVVDAISFLRDLSETYPAFPFNEKRLITSLYKMNYDAVNYRYEENHVYKYNPLPSFSHPNYYQMIKSVGCLLYQCSEGNIPNRKLYKELKKVKNDLAMHIVMTSPEYTKAKSE